MPVLRDQRSLRRRCGAERRESRREDREHAIAHCLEHVTVEPSDRLVENLEMMGDGKFHRVLVALPQASRPLEIGEEERRRARRRYESVPFSSAGVAGWDGAKEARAVVLEGLVSRADPSLQVH